MNIRFAKPADAQAIADIFNQYLGIATMMLEPLSATDYQPIIEAVNSPCVVMCNDAEIVIGFAYVKPYSNRGGYILAGEITIFMAPETVGKRLGGHLYDELLPEAYALGYRHLTAKIWANNGSSIRFHEGFGFRMVGTQVAIGLVGGKRIDTVIMERVW
ncbi:N-acetyltransferase [Neolewinella aurantiaca]|uniref:N-acetyltransferase n=1 Tax=Neolewinella aurantiaca TaxID=2602767 RepID=A0A5C7FKE8_9BACT|nr:GNAT family N-acetyltransferase [Neolewinella aurantiaca]TXF91809.1 N-acetyltransferase [Neolewinella aurantiaca]